MYGQRVHRIVDTPRVYVACSQCTLLSESSLPTQEESLRRLGEFRAGCTAWELLVIIFSP
jgi:hypothetical protein